MGKKEKENHDDILFLRYTLTPYSNPNVMMEAYNRKDASPLFFIAYLIITVYFVFNIVS